MSTTRTVTIHPVISDGFKASRLDIAVERDGAALVIRYAVDDRPPASIRVAVPNAPDVALDLIAVIAGIYLGSLVLAEEIHVERGARAGLRPALLPIAEALYDIRRWRDSLVLAGPPRLLVEPREALLDEQPLQAKRSVLLWSGGKDSTLGLVTLRANCYEVCPVHASVNVGAQAPERAAVEDLAGVLGVEHVDDLAIADPDFLDLSGAYAEAWDTFPLSNRVPFGRDLLLAALAVPWALHHGAGCISLGHDSECRTAEVVYRGKRIPRNDMEHARIAMAFEAVLKRHVSGGLRLLPPVANLTETRILRDMLVTYPDLMKRTSFCFWGRNCGRCGKCLRYYLADRVYGAGVLQFESDPLVKGACPELAELLASRDMLFQREVFMLLGRLVQRGALRSGHDELARFEAIHFADVEPHLDEWETQLLAVRPDPQVPRSFRPAFAGAADNRVASQP